MSKKIFSNIFLMVFVVGSLTIMTSCMNTNTGGTGLTVREPKPPTPPLVGEQSARLIDTYKSTLAIPDVGFTKTVEYPDSLQLVNGDNCRYVITEKSTLVQKENVVLIENKFIQTAHEKNAGKPCPAKMDKYVDYKKDMTLEKYTNSKVAIFMGSTDVETILKSNPEFKSAQVLTMQSTKLGDLDTLFVRMRLVDQDGESYLLESHFSSLNSFLDIVDRKFISMKTNEVLSYRKLITQ